MLLRTQTALFFSLLFAACTASPSEAVAEPEVFDLEFGPLTPAQLVGLELPVGYRPGDRLSRSLRDDPAVQTRYASGHRWQSAPQPERVVYRVVAYGRDRAVALLQVVLGDAHQQPVAAFATAAGITVGAPVGHAALPFCRDVMTMSQDHLSSIRRPGVILATDRAGVHLIAREGNVDSVLWVADDTLLPQIKAVLFRSAFRPVRECLARQDAAGAHAALQALGTGNWTEVPAAATAELEEVRAAVQALSQAKDEAPRAEFATALVAAQTEIAAAHPYAAFGLYRARLATLQQIAARITGSRPEAAAELATALRAAAMRHIEGRELRTPSDLAYAYVGRQSLAIDDHANALVERALEFERAATYGEALAARSRFDAALQKVGDLTAQYRDLFRRVVVAAANREAEGLRAARRTEAARYLDAVAARLAARQGAFDDETIENGYEVAAFLTRLDAYQALAGDDARIAWVAEQVPYARNFRGSGLVTGTTEHERQRNLFLGDYVQPRFESAVRAAEQARNQGLHVTAAMHELTAFGVAGGHEWKPLGAAALGETKAQNPGTMRRSLQLLAPFLGAVLPPVGPTTAEAQRLMQLLREGDSLGWPLLQAFALKLEPGDLASLNPRHVALVPRGETFVLEARDRPQGLDEDVSSLQRLSGISAATHAESRAIAAEQVEIDAERQAIDAVRPTLDARGAALEAEQQAIEAARAGAQANAEALRAFNQRVDARNVGVREVRPQQEALRGRIQALNARISAYNGRVSTNNERRMRERAAGGAKVDALLRTALEQWITERLGDHEAGLLAAGLDAAVVDQELRAAKWLLGRPAARPLPAFVVFDLPGHRELRLDAIERTIHQQPSNEALAQAVVEHFLLAQRLREFERSDTFFRTWARTFRWERDLAVLQRAIAAASELTELQRQHVQLLIAAAERR